MADIRYANLGATIGEVGTAQVAIVPVTQATSGELKRITTCLGSAIAGTDGKVIVSKNSTVIGTITLQTSASAAGDIDYLDVNGVYLVSGDFIKIANDGASDGTAVLSVVIDIKR